MMSTIIRMPFHTAFFPFARRACVNRHVRISFGLACVRRVAHFGSVRSRKALDAAAAQAPFGYPAPVLDALRRDLRQRRLCAVVNEWLFDPNAVHRTVEAALDHALNGDAVDAATLSIDAISRHLELANVMPTEAARLELAWQVGEAQRLGETLTNTDECGGIS